MAATDTDRAERIAYSITDEPSKAAVLCAIAMALAAVDEVVQAESSAEKKDAEKRVKSETIELAIEAANEQKGPDAEREEWELWRVPHEGASSKYLLCSGSRTHEITVDLADWKKNVIAVDGRLVASGFSAFGRSSLSGRVIPLTPLSSSVGTSVTIKVSKWLPPDYYRIFLTIGDQVLEYGYGRRP
jgi:hypothetical protein